MANYLSWVVHEAIPSTKKNIEYYVKLSDTIRQDIWMNEEQQNALNSLVSAGAILDTITPKKLRKQMEDKP